MVVDHDRALGLFTETVAESFNIIPVQIRYGRKGFLIIKVRVRTVFILAIPVHEIFEAAFQYPGFFIRRVFMGQGGVFNAEGAAYLIEIPLQ
jgi:hypothetical protein